MSIATFWDLKTVWCIFSTNSAFIHVSCGGHQDCFSKSDDFIVSGEMREAEKILYNTVEGGSDLEISDEENEEDEY